MGHGNSLETKPEQEVPFQILDTNIKPTEWWAILLPDYILVTIHLLVGTLVPSGRLYTPSSVPL